MDRVARQTFSLTKDKKRTRSSALNMFLAKLAKRCSTERRCIVLFNILGRVRVTVLISYSSKTRVKATTVVSIASLAREETNTFSVKTSAVTSISFIRDNKNMLEFAVGEVVFSVMDRSTTSGKTTLIHSAIIVSSPFNVIV